VTNPLFYVDVLDRDARIVVVDGSEGRHAVVVRRLRQGENVDVSDGHGAIAHCVISVVGRDRLELAIERVRYTLTPQPRFVVVQALPKGERAERAVELLTEVGVDVIVPWAAERCVTRWDESRAARGESKWRTVARAAGKQARRARLPDVTGLATTEDVVDLLRTAELAVVLHESAVEPIAGLPVPESGDVVLVVGPEGGISDSELAAFAAAGGLAVHLGPSVLRTSTAGVVGASVLLAATARWA
jgi:16S rRNA (uracil1498-N3)-methyltransferase